MVTAKQQEQELWTPDYTAKHLGLSVRRVRELREQIGRTVSKVDPATRRPVGMFRRADVEAYKQANTPTAEEQRGIVRRPAAWTSEAIAAVIAPPSIEPRPWCSIDDAAGASGLPKSVIVRLIEAGRLPAIDCGPRPGGRWRVRRADLATIAGDAIAAT